MNKMEAVSPAYCGFDCAKCPVRIATLERGADEQGRSCTGCREEGAKLPFCADCDIRKAALRQNPSDPSDPSDQLDQ